MKLKNRVIVWLVYLDSKRSRRSGRRLPRDIAVDNPKLEELIEAAKKLNLNPEAYPNKAYPRSWWDETGYIIVDKKWPKQELLKKLAEEIAKIRIDKSKMISR
ncbi:MAG: signal recognition particle subunit SRP19/SEC65 family protein [Candidatus Bathyarchaeia archaeon]|nr:signal recognition particle protein Srp19 [Candidatus Bathyarchaeota archaeon]